VHQRPLAWTFSTRARSAIFLDLNIKIEGDRITTTIYEKELNLFLYIPPHSCHSPGVVKGLIFGAVYPSNALCTNPDDRMPFIRKTYRRLLHRGHLAKDIKPLFLQAIQKQLESKPTIAANQAATTAELQLPETNPRAILNHNDTSGELDPLYLHLPFNRMDTSLKAIQQSFRDNLIQPPGQQHISELETESSSGGPVNFNRLTICYHGQRKLSCCYHHVNYISAMILL